MAPTEGRVATPEQWWGCRRDTPSGMHHFTNEGNIVHWIHHWNNDQVFHVTDDIAVQCTSNKPESCWNTVPLQKERRCTLIFQQLGGLWDFWLYKRPEQSHLAPTTIPQYFICYKWHKKFYVLHRSDTVSVISPTLPPAKSHRLFNMGILQQVVCC